MGRVAQKQWQKHKMGKKGHKKAPVIYRRLLGIKSMQKPLNIFFWAYYGLFRGRFGLFTAFLDT